MFIERFDRKTSSEFTFSSYIIYSSYDKSLANDIKIKTCSTVNVLFKSVCFKSAVCNRLECRTSMTEEVDHFLSLHRTYF